MSDAAFFDRPEAAAVIEEASIAASMPVAVHALDAGPSQRTAGCGSCTVCRTANATMEGAAACRESRETASAQAMRRNRAVPFVCHLGLSCVAAPLAIESDKRYAITFGPFCPAEAPEGLDAIVREGLRAIGINEPPELADIARVSANGVPILVEWTCGKLDALRQAATVSEPSGNALEVEPEQPRPVKSRSRARGPASIIVIALAADDRATARWFLRNALEEAAALPDGAVHARAISLVSQVLEASEQARLRSQGAWNGLEEFVARSRQASNIAELSRACMRVLSFVRPKRQRATAEQIAILFKNVSEYYADGILLEDIAAKIGTDPTAITHLLQRRFGLNYSELVGKIRVERAKRLLRESQFSIVEIARRVGVSDASNFGRLFRKFEGVAPLHYRERFRRAA